MSRNVHISGESGSGGGGVVNTTSGGGGVVVVERGGFTRLHCHYNSRPEPQLSWTLDGEVLVLPSNRLVFIIVSYSYSTYNMYVIHIYYIYHKSKTIINLLYI